MGRLTDFNIIEPYPWFIEAQSLSSKLPNIHYYDDDVKKIREYYDEGDFSNLLCCLETRRYNSYKRIYLTRDDMIRMLAFVIKTNVFKNNEWDIIKPKIKVFDFYDDMSILKRNLYDTATKLKIGRCNIYTVVAFVKKYSLFIINNEQELWDNYMCRLKNAHSMTMTKNDFNMINALTQKIDEFLTNKNYTAKITMTSRLSNLMQILTGRDLDM